MTKTFLDSVYDLDSAEATRDLYDDWSGSYDDEIAQNGYATPARIAEALGRHMQDHSVPILDFACGTGLSGQALLHAGFSVIDGCDLSPEMLAKAEEKQIYRKTWQVAPDAEIAKGYAAITAAGAIAVGAAPVETIDKVAKALTPGGFFALSFNDHTLEEPEFEARLRTLCEAKVMRLLFQEYGTHLPGIGLKSNVYLLEKL